MNDLFVYALKSAVCLSVLYIPFYLLLRKETFFRLNRMTLLSILVASLLMPLADFTLPQQMPVCTINPTFNATFPGGDEALEAYLNTQMGALSAELQSDTLENLYVKFWVLKDGRLDFIEVLSAVDETVTQQLTRIISEMPRWNPASHLGEKRASEVILPIKL